MRIPYTTKKGVKIGLRYEQPLPQLTRDEEVIQAALLGVRRPVNVPLYLVLACLVVGYLLVSYLQ